MILRNDFQAVELQIVCVEGGEGKKSFPNSQLLIYYEKKNFSA